MKTAVEIAKDGTRLRIYHRAGTTEMGPDTRYAWTHPIEEVESCEACQSKRVPTDIRQGKRSAIAGRNQ